MAIKFTSLDAAVTPEINMVDKKAEVVSISQVLLHGGARGSKRQRRENRGAEGVGHWDWCLPPQPLRAGADSGVEIVGPYRRMASAELEPITWVWELCPQRVPGNQGAKPPEAERFFVL